MTKVEELAVRLVERVNAVERKEDAVAAVSMGISWFVNDVLKLAKNINETSLNSTDHFNRLIKMEEEFGISKTHLIR